MGRFVLHRFLYSCVLLLVVSALVFFGLRVAPGSVMQSVINPFSQEKFIKTAEAKRLGLDKPLLDQYLLFLNHVVTGRLGLSLVSGLPISTIILHAGEKTAELAAAAILLTYGFSIPFGVLAGWKRNSLVDRLLLLVAVLGMGIPNFFLAVLLIQLFAVNLRWLPVAGSTGFSSLILPAVVLSAEAVAINFRLMRSSLLDEVHREYVQSLRARGLSESRIVWRHGLRNALPPVVALAGVMIRTIVGYSMIVEVIFSWPGLGFQLVNSVLQRDYTLAQMLALLLAAVVIVANFLADVGHRLADPRIRGQGGQA